MSWKNTIQTSGAQWSALMEYVDERIDSLTQECIDPDCSEMAIRSAQRSIAELKRLQNIPDMLRAEAQIKAHGLGHRKEY